MKPEVWQKIAAQVVPLDQTDLGLTIEKDEVDRFYEPLASWIISQAGKTERTLVALAGPPGSGKSAFAAILRVVIDAVAGEACSLVIGLDGWHYPNDYLLKKSITKNGETILLRSIKGAAETFDVAAIFDLIGEIKSRSEVKFPVYSRKLHDPVPGAGEIQAQHRILLLEGNYLLLDAERWRDLYSAYDLKIFLDADDDILETCLLERHVRGGKSTEAAWNHVSGVDLLNARYIKNHVNAYNVHVVKKNCVQIERMDFLTDVIKPQRS